MITRIRIPSQWRDTSVDLGRQHYGHADFQMGPGPCGRNVVALDVDFQLAGVAVCQVCEPFEDLEEEVKIFFYPWATVMGRVEITEIPDVS